jgi:neopullulanase
MKKTFFLLLITSISFAQIERVEPPFWWSGMVNKELQILFHGKDVSNSLISADNVIVEIHHEGFNKDYVYVTIQLPENPQDIEFTFKNYSTNVITNFTYSIKKRRENSKNRKGFDDSDAIYLIMPDRFANGNPSNDSTEDTQQIEVCQVGGTVVIFWVLLII